MLVGVSGELYRLNLRSHICCLANIPNANLIKVSQTDCPLMQSLEEDEASLLLARVSRDVCKQDVLLNK